MRALLASLVRNHGHALLIVPLVAIAITWPTFARIFDSYGFWFPTAQVDGLERIWDSWHIERVLAGQAQLFYTDAMFHPQGTSLALREFSFPHALLFIIAKQLMPSDRAYNLLFLAILCFNMLSAYVLVLRLLKDKWIALFGALVFGLSLPILGGSTTPDLITVGTIPISMYFIHRFLAENRRIFAALAGLCAGATAFINVYAFIFILMTVGIFGFYWSLSHWKQPAFWRGCLLFIIVTASISAFRFGPMLIHGPVFKEGLESFLNRNYGFEVLQCCALTGNPVTGDLFRKVFTKPLHSSNVTMGVRYNSAYLGYINLFLALYAMLHKPWRKRLTPWLATLVCFTVLRLGHFLVINGVQYPDILLPQHFLRLWFPTSFGFIHSGNYYQFGAILPLAILASHGLARLIRSVPTERRVYGILLFALVVVIELYSPLPASRSITPDKIAYGDWLSAQTDSAIKLINLPQNTKNADYYKFLQTMNNYPMAYGYIYRNQGSSREYIRNNMLLNTWDKERSPHCLPRNEPSYILALDQLLEDGFTHVVVHKWLEADESINPSFWNVPAAYADGFVNVYRLADLRLNCDSRRIELAPIKFFAESQTAVPGRQSSILSFHSTESIDAYQFAYLDSLFSDWQSLLHLYLDADELSMQNAGIQYPDLDAFARDNQLIYLLYNKRDADAAALRIHESLDRFNLCQRDEYADGSHIELYLSQEFSCELIRSAQPLQVDYDNGIRLHNALLNRSPDRLHFQILWSSLPDEPHSMSLQVFDAAGVKVLSQDSTLGHLSLARYDLDVSHLPRGDYAVKLVVYNYQTKRSVSGVVSRTGERFERELAVANLTRN